MRRAVVVFLAAAVLGTGCSKSKHITFVSPPTTTSAPTATRPLSKAAGDRQLCAAYDAFWNTPSPVGEPGPVMLARERALVAAAEATPDQSLHDAVRAVIDGELGLPRFYLHDTAAAIKAQASTFAADAKEAFNEVELNDAAVRSTCSAVGRPVQG